jgi:hypothetical protein
MKGRPPNVPDSYYTETMNNIVKPRWDELLQKAVDIALRPVVNRESVTMLIYIMNRVLGVPAQEVNHNTEGNIEVTVRKVNARSDAELQEILKEKAVLVGEMLQNTDNEIDDEQNNDR